MFSSFPRSRFWFLFATNRLAALIDDTMGDVCELFKGGRGHDVAVVPDERNHQIGYGEIVGKDDLVTDV